jgi:2-oxoglutarate dehydrogenase E2 component (dihydrolipoamide succinyltransferase)
MARFDIVMPKLGESIIEATITRWLKKEGETVQEEDALVEIATDKVDSEIPSPVDGVITKLLFNEGDVVPVGQVIAHLEVEGAGSVASETAAPVAASVAAAASEPKEEAQEIAQVEEFPASDRFLSALVKCIAKKENISLRELASVPGSGLEGRLTKNDILAYISQRSTSKSAPVQQPAAATPKMTGPAVTTAAGDQVIEMDRMRKLIADHMVHSVHTSPHVTSFVEVDMTPIVRWRDKVKDSFFKREGIRLTYTHVFLDAIAKTIKEFPMVNASVDGDRIILKKRVNIGMAVALPSGNLIVPVIADVDQKSILGIAKASNDLAERARINKLVPDEIQGGTITLTNLGSFGTVMGTPIINQPQVAIVAVGAITKRPVVMETEAGDVIAIRHMMYASISYDHRIVDGALGGQFIYRFKQILESFDPQTDI